MIFGVGLSRTGTRSLSEALIQLRYRTAHYIQHKTALRGAGTWFAGDFQSDCLSGYDAAIDLPIPIFFRQLDERYPGSRFILTLRDPIAWIASVRRHWQAWPITDDPAGNYRRTLRQTMYGTDSFSATRMLQVYHAHVRNVQRHFRARPEALLILNVCDGDGWKKLCPFVDRPEPATPFPWFNKA
jgi:hypothetical protein